ncbi:MAG: FKBP-type peptidyl-prolyl cis-trans isomerase [Prevotella sp.]|nr:FKBP-type peptidyl-prolyl cis-trans isomerase [Prevotella sp.]
MKRIIVLALAALVAGASFNTALADKKKKKKAKEEQQQEVVEVKQPVQLVTSSDSLSYAAGITMTNGLMPFLQQQLKVDTAYMADFVRGLNEALTGKETPAQQAYRAGFQIADQVKSGMLPRMKQEFTDTPDSIIEPILFRGFVDAIAKDESVMNMRKAERLFKKKQESNHEAMVAAKNKVGREFLAENAKKEGVITTPSGLQYKVLVQGSGQVPQATDKVKVNYEGRLIDGTVFDASSKHGNDPISFRADQVIRGWTEALTMMPVGSKWQLYIPQELGYGERQAGNIPPYSVLIFDVELVGIEK